MDTATFSEISFHYTIPGGKSSIFSCRPSEDWSFLVDQAINDMIILLDRFHIEEIIDSASFKIYSNIVTVNLFKNNKLIYSNQIKKFTCASDLYQIIRELRIYMNLNFS